jgi:pimeloyl-ACP methyl ester carboxylesterase
LEGLLGFPLGHHEVPVVALHWSEQLEPEESGLIIDRVGAVGEPLLQLRTGAGGHFDCVDLDHGHGAKATVPLVGCGTAQDDVVTNEPLTYRGGSGDPLVLVHGLMGRGSTWSRQLPWLTRLGSVYTYDAPWHRGRDANDIEPVSTERFVDELGAAVDSLGRPVVLIGHSMGGLHSWCLAAERPELVTALVVEDMAPDFVGRTTGPWEPWLHALPKEYGSAEQVVAEFGPLAGRYFLEAFDRTSTGWRLHGRPERWLAIAAEWGTRDYWQQWRSVRAPVLLIEAGDSVAPPGQMLRMRDLAGSRADYLRVPGAGHLVHDDAPEAYQDAVEAFLTGLQPDVG